MSPCGWDHFHAHADFARVVYHRLMTYGTPMEDGTPYVPLKVRCGDSGQLTNAGTLCGMWAIPGLTKCKHHAPKLPGAKEAGKANLEAKMEIYREQLAALVPKAIERLSEALDSEKDEVMLRAAEAVMNRNGMQVVKKVETKDVTKSVISVDDQIDALIEKRQREADLAAKQRAEEARLAAEAAVEDELRERRHSA